MSIRKTALSRQHARAARRAWHPWHPAPRAWHASLVFLILASLTRAQTLPWITFEDAVSSSVCDVVHASNAELVVHADSSNLVLVGGPDVVLSDAFVDEEGNVIFEGEPTGVVEFQTDGNGFRTLWWTGLTGNVVEVDEFTGAPSPTNLRPSDFRNVACDGCDFWDDPTVCDQPEPPPPPEPVTIQICGQNIMLPLAILLVFLVVAPRRSWRVEPKST